MGKRYILILATLAFIIHLHGIGSISTIANVNSQSQVSLVISFGPPQILEALPLRATILITDPHELPEGFVSHKVNMRARSAHPTGYYVNIQGQASHHIGPDQSFRMVKVHDHSYFLEFDVLSDKAPDGSDTPVHHQGFGHPQGGTPHYNDSKIINTNLQPRPDLQIYGLHFFIHRGQFFHVPAGHYITSLRLNLIDTS